MHTIVGAQPCFFDENEAILQEIRELLKTGQLTEGPFVTRLEQAFKERCGFQHAAAVSSGGAGLELIFQALGVEGKEVIVPTDTFVATVFSVIRAGGKPVLADVEKNTLALSCRTVAPLITDKTAAVVIVHMFGIMSTEIDQLKKMCTDRGVALIEDAAHAHGASYEDVSAGALGDAAAFSFYPTKIMTMGEGGMITTHRADIDRSVRQLRTYGKQIDGTVFEMVGANARLAEIPAILGYYQLNHLEENIAHRRAIAKKYTEQLTGFYGVECLETDDKRSRHSYWRFPFYLDRNRNRMKFQAMMAEQYHVRITWMYEPLCHLQPALKDRYGYKEGDFPQAEACMSRLICLPTHGGVSDADAERVIEGVKTCLPLCKV